MVSDGGRGNVPEGWLVVEPTQDRGQVVVELRRDSVEVPRAIQGQEKDVFLGKGDVEVI